jgi:hypothetical protein
MNHHGRIVEEISRQYNLWSDAVIVSPSALAHSVYSSIASGTESDTVNYLSLEQLKQMCREFLRRRKEPDGEENEAHGAQGTLPLGIDFSGNLQDRYPIPRQSGEEPTYKLRHLLTPEERRWNVMLLRKSAQARQKHADALEAEGNEQQVAA